MAEGVQASYGTRLNDTLASHLATFRSSGVQDRSISTEAMGERCKKRRVWKLSSKGQSLRWTDQDEAEQREVLGFEWGENTRDKLCLLNTVPQHFAVNTPLQL